MKQLLSIAAVFMVLLVGCSNDVNINSPVANQATEEFVKRTCSENHQVNASLTISKVIVGANGGYLSTSNLFTTQSGTKGNIYGSCCFPAGAFSGSTTITITADDVKLTGTFPPSITFSKPVSFSALFTGVDLSKLN